MSTAIGSFTNLVDNYLAQGDIPAARRTQANFERILPSHMGHWRSKAAILLAEEQFDSVYHLARTAFETSTSGATRDLASFVAASVALLKGQVKDMLQWSRRGLSQAAEDYDSRAPMLTIVLDSALALGLFRGDTLGARAVVRRGLVRIPLDSLRPADRPYQYLSFLARYSRDAELARLAYEGWARDTAGLEGIPEASFLLRANMAFASGKPDEAIGLLREADRHQFSYERTHFADMAYGFDLAGHSDSAITYYERFLVAKLSDLEIDPQYLAAAYKRLGELYDGKGDAERAITNYQRLVDLWKAADPELQPIVQRARARAAELARRRG